jgi:hypothetical protein
LKELENLVNKYPKISHLNELPTLKIGIADTASLLLVIIDDELAHYSWIAQGRVRFIYDYYFKWIDFEEEIYIGPCYTFEKYRGLSLYALALSSICNAFVSDSRIKKASILTRKRNESSYRGILKSPFKIKAIVKGTYFLFFSHWVTRNIQSIKEI